MAEEFDRFLINLVYAVDGASKARFTGGVKEARRDVKALGQATDETERKVRGFFGRIKSGIGVVKGLAAAWAGFKIGQKAVGLLADSLERLNNLKSISDITGAAAHDIERWSYFADQTGSSASAMIAALQSIRRTSRAAAGGMERFAESYRGLGVATQVNGALRSSTDIMADIIDRFKNLDQAKREFYAQRLGIDDTLIASLVGNDVRGTIGEYDRMAAAAGLNLNEAAKSANNLYNEIGRLKTMGRVLWTSIASAFASPLAKMFKDIHANILKNARTIRTLLGGSLRLLGYLLRGVSEAVMLVVRSVDSAIRVWDLLPPSVQKTVVAVAALVAGIQAFNKVSALGLLTNPFVLWTLGVAALLLALDDLRGWFDGEDSLIDWGKAFERLKEEFQPVIDFVTTAFAPLFELFDALIAKWPEMGGLINEYVVQPLISLFDRTIRFFTETVPNGFKNAFAGLKQWFVDLFYSAVDLLPDSVVHSLGMQTKAERDAAADGKKFKAAPGSPAISDLLRGKPGVAVPARAPSAFQAAVANAAANANSLSVPHPLGVRPGSAGSRHYEDNRRVTVEARINVDGTRSPDQTGAVIKRDIEDLTVRNLSTPVTFAPAGSE